MPSPVTAGRSFIPGLRSDALSTYRRMYDIQREKLSAVMQIGLPSTRRTEFYFFWRSAPHIIRWAYGRPLPFKGFHGVRFNVTNVRFAMGIAWFADDRADDQTQSLVSQARQLGDSAALHEERVFFQMMLGSTDDDLLAAAGSDPGNEDSDGGIPNAPDGAALFSAANARFGAARGNLIAGTAVTAGITEATFRADYFSAREQFGLFQETEGQPLFNPSLVESKATLIFNMSNWNVAAAAFQRSVIPESSAGVSSEIMAAGLAPDLWPTQRLTTDDFAVGLTGPEMKAVFSQHREEFQEVMATDQNSDITRIEDKEFMRFKLRSGFGVNEPYSLIWVDEEA